ncbi:MAG TPA: PfaD family polyunsaturated fatty acid/polyketide biosynthesis protein [Chloroflexota bacterium]|nr:PfaD family polyunsaturated fatty acid/polyketide biosynthesis protein [Chloroflexota bacterium]
MTAMMTASTETSERRTILSGRSDLLQHHRILDVQILPGAGFVAMAIEASTGHAGGGYQLQSLRLLRPLPVPEDQESEVSASVERRADGALSVRVRSHPVGTEDGWVEHASGVAVPVSAVPPETLDLAGITARATSVAAQDEIYQVYALTGIALGKAFQVIQRAWLISQYETIAELRFGEAARAALPDHAFNPAMLDGCFQATYGVVLPRMLAELRTDGAAPQWTMVPYRVSKLVVHRSLPEHAYSYVRLLEQHPTRDLSSITVADAEGRVCLSFELLSVRIAVRDVVRSIGGDLTPPTPLSGAERGLGGEVNLQDVLEDISTAVVVRSGPAGLRILPDGPSENGASDGEVVAWAPALLPERLGSPEFRRVHGARYAYVIGEMANGIASEELVAAAAQAKLLAFFGAGGLEPGRVAEAVHRIKQTVEPDAPLGFSLLHDVHDLLGSQKVVDLYLEQGIRCVNASAFIMLTAPLVQYRVSGIHQRSDGEIVVPNRLFAKISRAEVARRFMEPPPPQFLDQLLREGRITEREAELARLIPMADDITAEGDSGGHTDRQVLSALLPTMRALRDEIVAQQRYTRPIRVGAAGGLGTPESVAAAFMLGADYVLTGSINQGCVESGTSPLVRQMLAEATSSDVAMAADAGSFEMGSQVQVLRRGTLFASRSQRLLELYRRYGSLAEIPDRERQQLESNVFRMSVDEIWRSTQAFFERVDPRQLERAARDEHHKMALVMRWYLGLSSGWAQQGLDDRRVDFQVWCGPAMGAFNTWARGSFLEAVENRSVVQVAENLMHGAAALVRRQWLTAQGVPLPESTLRYRPRRFAATA